MIVRNEKERSGGERSDSGESVKGSKGKIKNYSRYFLSRCFFSF